MYSSLLTSSGELQGNNKSWLLVDNELQMLLDHREVQPCLTFLCWYGLFFLNNMALTQQRNNAYYIITSNPEADSEILDSSIGLYFFFLAVYFLLWLCCCFQRDRANQPHSWGHLRGSLAQGWNTEPHTGPDVSSVCMCCGDLLQATVWMNGQQFSESRAGFLVADVLVLGKKILIYQSKNPKWPNWKLRKGNKSEHSSRTVLDFLATSLQ